MPLKLEKYAAPVYKALLVCYTWPKNDAILLQILIPLWNEPQYNKTEWVSNTARAFAY